MLLRGPQPRPVLAQVVGVGAVDDGVEAAGPCHLAEAGPQLGLAEVASVGGIGEVARVGQLVRADLEQRDLVPAGELDGAPPLRLRVRGAPTDDGEESLRPQRLAGDDGQQRGVDPARVAKQHPPVAEQAAPQEIEVGHGQ